MSTLAARSASTASTMSISKKARLPVRTELQAVLSTLLSGNDLKNYIKRLDAQLCQVYHYSQEEYITQARQIIYNLSINGDFLVKTYSPETLAVLNSEELGKGTAMDTKRREYLQRRREFARIVDTELEQITFQLTEEQLKQMDKEARRCPHCKQKKVITRSFQKRSGDEGMSNYGYCQNKACMKTFAINS